MCICHSVNIYFRHATSIDIIRKISILLYVYTYIMKGLMTEWKKKSNDFVLELGNILLLIQKYVTIDHHNSVLPAADI